MRRLFALNGRGVHALHRAGRCGCRVGPRGDHERFKNASTHERLRALIPPFIGGKTLGRQRTMPTLYPGCIRWPLWRTMIDPGFAVCPVEAHHIRGHPPSVGRTHGRQRNEGHARDVTMETPVEDVGSIYVWIVDRTSEKFHAQILRIRCPVVLCGTSSLLRARVAHRKRRSVSGPSNQRTRKTSTRTAADDILRRPPFVRNNI